MLNGVTEIARNANIILPVRFRANTRRNVGPNQGLVLPSYESYNELDEERGVIDDEISNTSVVNFSGNQFNEQGQGLHIPINFDGVPTPTAISLAVNDCVFRNQNIILFNSGGAAQTVNASYTVAQLVTRVEIATFTPEGVENAGNLIWESDPLDLLPLYGTIEVGPFQQITLENQEFDFSGFTFSEVAIAGFETLLVDEVNEQRIQVTYSLTINQTGTVLLVPSPTIPVNPLNNNFNLDFTITQA